jgi:hypothetical protein
MKIPEKFTGRYLARSTVQRESAPPAREEIPITPDRLDVLDAIVVPAMPWGRWLGVGFFE